MQLSLWRFLAIEVLKILKVQSVLLWHQAKEALTIIFLNRLIEKDILVLVKVFKQLSNLICSFCE